MKRIKKEKKRKNTSSSKDLQLPIIQRNIQKGNIKPLQSSSSMPKTTIQKIANIQSNPNDMPQIPNIVETKTIPKEMKTFRSSTNISQNTNKTRKVIGNRKKKMHYYKEFKEEVNPNNEFIKEEVPKISKEKLYQLKDQRRKRLQQAKIEEEKQLKIYCQLIESFKNKSKDNKNKILLNKENSKVSKISEQKAQKILEDGGMLDAYKYLLSQLCRHGLPNGNVFEYASIVVKNYEKKWKEKKSKMLKEKIEQYYEEKQKEINNILESDGEIKKVNKSLEHREEYKFIRSLDKSRSKRNIIPRISSPPLQENISNFNRNIIRNFKILKDAKTNIDKYENNNIIPLKLKDIGSDENEGIIKNNIAKTALNSQYNKNDDKMGNSINVKDIENNNNENKNIAKRKKTNK